MCFIFSKQRQQLSNGNMDTTQNICVTHGPGQVIISPGGCLLSSLLCQVRTSRRELCFGSVTEPWQGPDFQQTGHTPSQPFPIIYISKYMHKTPSDDNPASARKSCNGATSNTTNMHNPRLRKTQLQIGKNSSDCLSLIIFL